VQRLDAALAQAWIDDTARTVHVLDVRSEEEFTAGTLAGARHAPGGQLLQATDQSIGVRNGRVLLLDDEDVRAPVVAAWLHRLGYETAVVEGGIRAPLRMPAAKPAVETKSSQIDALALGAWVAAHQPRLLDLQDSRAHRRQHAQGARWSIRSRLPADARAAGSADDTVLLLAAEAGIARLAVAELAEAGWPDVHWALAADWVAAGLPVAASPGTPADADAIDYLLFVHDRHDGNLEAARQYLAWETGLIAQCAPDELAVFRLPSVAPAAH
jgi:rhodanese-related sulfurtransferase